MSIHEVFDEFHKSFGDSRTVVSTHIYSILNVVVSACVNANNRVSIVWHFIEYCAAAIPSKSIYSVLNHSIIDVQSNS